jgi:hypothetical protein
MKSIIATVILAAAAGQAHADGFYQAVIDQTNPVIEEIATGRTEFAYSPLYLQVVGDGERRFRLDAGQQIATSMFSYTPLYLTVTGNAS